MVKRKDSYSDLDSISSNEYSQSGIRPASPTVKGSISRKDSLSSIDESLIDLQEEKLFKQFERNFNTIGADVGKLFKTSLERKGKIDLDPIELSQTQKFNIFTRIPSVDKDIQKTVENPNTVERINEVKNSVIKDIEKACSPEKNEKTLKSQNKLLNQALASELAEKAVSDCQLKQGIFTSDLKADFMPKKAELVSKLSEMLNKKINLFENPIFSIRTDKNGEKLEAKDYKFGVISQNKEFIEAIGSSINEMIGPGNGKDLGSRFEDLSDKDIERIANKAIKSYKELVKQKDFSPEKINKSSKALEKKAHKEEKRMHKQDEKVHEKQSDEIILDVFKKIKDSLPKDNKGMDEEQKEKFSKLKEALVKIDPKFLKESAQDFVNYISSSVKINLKEDGKYHLETKSIERQSKDLINNVQLFKNGPSPIAIPDSIQENGIETKEAATIEINAENAKGAYRAEEIIPGVTTNNIIYENPIPIVDQVVNEQVKVSEVSDSSSRVYTYSDPVPVEDQISSGEKVNATINEDGDVHFEIEKDGEFDVGSIAVDEDVQVKETPARRFESEFKIEEYDDIDKAEQAVIKTPTYKKEPSTIERNEAIPDLELKAQLINKTETEFKTEEIDIKSDKHKIITPKAQDRSSPIMFTDAISDPELTVELVKKPNLNIVVTEEVDFDNAEQVIETPIAQDRSSPIMSAKAIPKSTLKSQKVTELDLPSIQEVDLGDDIKIVEKPNIKDKSQKIVVSNIDLDPELKEELVTSPEQSSQKPGFNLISMLKDFLKNIAELLGFGSKNKEDNKLNNVDKPSIADKTSEIKKVDQVSQTPVKKVFKATELAARLNLDKNQTLNLSGKDSKQTIQAKSQDVKEIKASKDANSR